jgi:uncharacterized protein (TIGR00725 family)
MGVKGMQIGVVGGGKCSDEIARLAFDVGRGIALQGGRVICGGLGGVMEAAAKGAKEVGGLTVGILPTYSRDSANPYIDIVIPSGMGLARNVLVVSASQAVVALAGSDGTRSEISLALQMRKMVVGLQAWGEIPGVVLVQTVKGALESIFSGARRS